MRSCRTEKKKERKFFSTFPHIWNRKRSHTSGNKRQANGKRKQPGHPAWTLRGTASHLFIRWHTFWQGMTQLLAVAVTHVKVVHIRVARHTNELMPIQPNSDDQNFLHLSVGAVFDSRLSISHKTQLRSTLVGVAHKHFVERWHYTSECIHFKLISCV